MSSSLYKIVIADQSLISGTIRNVHYGWKWVYNDSWRILPYYPRSTYAILFWLQPRGSTQILEGVWT